MKYLLFPVILIPGFLVGSLFGFVTSVNRVDKMVQDMQYELKVSHARAEFWRARAQGVCEDPVYEEEYEEIYL